jgi:aryl-alcohol dehydrogenase-like predicted oxidoreductase
MPTDEITAAAPGTWTLGDRTVNRMGFGSMRITANPDRELAIRVLRRAVELGVNHVDTAARRHRSDDEFVKICAKRGIAFVPFFAIAGAKREAGAITDHSEAVRAVSLAHEATPHQVRLAWTLHQGPHVLAIPGTGDPDHLVQNIAAGALRLSADELASLE